MKHLLLWLCIGGTANAASTTGEDDKHRKVAVVPLVNFTTDRGVGYGAYGAVFFGEPIPNSPVPYRAQFGVQYYRTTGGYQDHKLNIDLPDMVEGRLRAKLEIGLESWDGAFYFGQGNRLPRLPESVTPSGFYTYGLESLRIVSQLRFPVSSYFDVFIGQLARSAKLNILPNSRLEHDQPIGIEGGLLSQMLIGAIHDTRDHEFVPSQGAFTELSLRGAHPMTGSSWRMWGTNFTDRHFWTLTDESLVLATRAAIDIQRGEVPFFHQMVMGGSQWVDIGGRTAMRGLPIGRYRGNTTTYGDAELRWEVTNFAIGNGHYRFFAVSFIGGARIIEPSATNQKLDAHGGIGVGLRLLYDDVFLARFDFALGREEYTTENQPFGTDTETLGWIPGVYLAFDTPY